MQSESAVVKYPLDNVDMILPITKYRIHVD